MSAESPSVFVSYSWDSEVHRDWIAALATRLTQDGVRVQVDQWDLVPGDQLPKYMEAAVRENDFVLCVCTPKYKKRSDTRQGGVGYEGNIMTAEVLSGLSVAKFIPVLRAGSWEESAPSWLLGSLYVNLSNDGFESGDYKRLLARLYRSKSKRPDPGAKPNWIAPKGPKGRFKLVAFDLDGTLLRGFDFSWRLIWDHLGFPDSLRKKGMQRYLAHEIDYREWCEWCVEHFREAGLARSAFREIAKRATVTKNLEVALKRLRKEGLLTAIVSGGVDALLYEMIPKADELFDYIFINRLQFDDSDALTGIVPTMYDYEGKPIAIEKICDERGIDPSEAVFVGEGHNDAFVVGRVGLVLAYPPNDQQVDQGSHVGVSEDNLLHILPIVLQT